MAIVGDRQARDLRAPPLLLRVGERAASIAAFEFDSALQRRPLNVRFGLESGRWADIAECLKSATFGLMQCSKITPDGARLHG